MLRGVRRDLRRLRVWRYQPTLGGLLAWRWWEPPSEASARRVWDSLVEREQWLLGELARRE